MDYPYQLDDLNNIYNILDANKTLDTNNTKNTFNVNMRSLETSIENICLKRNISDDTLNKKNENKQADILIKKSKKSRTIINCKRCNIYSFDKCECIIKSLDLIYISGKRRKITNS